MSDPNSAPDPNGVYVAALGAGVVDGGEGFDTLQFGNLQASFAFGFNQMGVSGGRYAVTQPSTGSGGMVEFRNIESIVGSPFGDQLMTNGQIVSLYGEAGDDTLSAQMDAPSGVVLRGGEGNDSLSGESLFDDLNGNQGNDTVNGWEGADWVLGGQGNDLLFGGAGDDYVQGNLGDDTVDGGAGADVVRGGQGDDLVMGGAGNDQLFGDLGADTLTGGAGADVFHVEISRGADLITDFNAADGDRLKVDGDVDFSAEQVGDDIRVTLTYGAFGSPEVILQHASLASMPSGWIGH